MPWWLDRDCRFHTPLIEPDMQVSRIRLSDKISRLHPRHAPSKSGQTYQPIVLVKVRVWIGPTSLPSGLMLGAQPPEQPHCGIAVEQPIRLAGGPYREVVRQPRSVRFNFAISSVVSCHVPFRSVSAWTVSTARLMLFFDGR